MFYLPQQTHDTRIVLSIGILKSVQTFRTTTS